MDFMRLLRSVDLDLVAPLLAIAALGLGAAIAEVRARMR